MNLFKFHKLNSKGIQKAQAIQTAFEVALASLEAIIGDGKQTREFSIVKTKLEESCFFAKKSMAIMPENQEEQQPIG